MQTYATKKKSVTPSPAGAKAAENISKSDMLHMSGAGAPQPMSAALREKFEPSFGADFSNIRISRGHIPDAMGVQAVAKGTDILVDSRAGMDVLGHELAHVVQQAQGRVSSGGFPVVHNAGLEHEADVMGARAASGLSAMQGGMSGFGGETMQIAPMSDASAPAQCKSKAEKKMDDAQKKLDERTAAGDRMARGDYGQEMRQIVENMSEKDIHNPKIQQKLVSIAGQRANAGLKSRGNDEDWEVYSTVLRGGESGPEQQAMNALLTRLIGRDQLRDTLKSSASNEDKLAALTNQVEGNEEVMRLMGDFTNQAFDGVNATALQSEESRNSAIMNNFMTRILSPACVNTAKEKEMTGKNKDIDVFNGAHEVQKMATSDSATGAVNSNSEAVQRFMSLPTRARAQAAQPVQKKKGFFAKLFGR